MWFQPPCLCTRTSSAGSTFFGSSSPACTLLILQDQGEMSPFAGKISLGRHIWSFSWASGRLRRRSEVGVRVDGEMGKALSSPGAGGQVGQWRHSVVGQCGLVTGVGVPGTVLLGGGCFLAFGGTGARNPFQRCRLRLCSRGSFAGPCPSLHHVTTSQAVNPTASSRRHRAPSEGAQMAISVAPVPRQ